MAMVYCASEKCGFSVDSKAFPPYYNEVYQDTLRCFTIDRIPRDIPNDVRYMCFCFKHYWL